MTREELFLAIGQVEESRLARTELTVQGPSAESNGEEPQMKKKRVNFGRVIRNLLIAAAIISMLGITAYAAAAYLIFDSPEEMVTAIFGDQTGFDHGARGEITDKDGNVLATQYRHDRVPADEKVVAQEAAPLVEPVQQSLSWAGYTLTIDANLYDHATKCGLVTYTLENPNGVDYDLHSDGEISDVVNFSQYGRKYIIQDKTTDICLAATYYYQLRDPGNTDLDITFSQWTAISFEDYLQLFKDTKAQLKQEISEDEVIAHVKEQMGEDYALMEAESSRDTIIEQGYDGLAYERMGVLDGAYDQYICNDKITISENTQSEMTSISLGNEAVRISPIAITVKVEEIEDFPNSFLDVTKIQFSDGTEYVVKEDYTLNYVFAVADSETEETTFMFNRIIDVNEVTSVIVDGNIELTVD